MVSFSSSTNAIVPNINESRNPDSLQIRLGAMIAAIESTARSRNLKKDHIFPGHSNKSKKGQPVKDWMASFYEGKC